MELNNIDYTAPAQPGLRILLFEDFQPDAELISRALKKEINQPEILHLKKPVGLPGKIKHFNPDVILSDYSMPAFTGMEIMQQCKDICPYTPFIIITGAIDEETAANCIKSGASDYILKDNLIRLPQAVIGAVEKSTSLKEKREAEESLQKKEKQLSLILDTSPVGIIEIDKDGKIKFANTQALGILGYSSEEILDIDYFNSKWEVSAISGKPLTKNELPFERVKKTQKPVSGLKYKINRGDGKELFLSINANPVFDTKGGIAGIVASLQDITNQVKVKKEFKASENRYRSLFENMLEAIAYYKIITDSNGTPTDYMYIEANPAFEFITGLTRDKIIGKTAKEVHPGIKGSWIKKCSSIALTGQPARFQYYWQKTGKHLEVNAFSPEKGFFVTAFNDITKRVEYETKLKNYQQKLKALNSELVLIEEKEKRRLAVNLHDHFSQLLAISKIRLSELINENSNKQEKTQLTEIRGYIDKALQNSRKLTYELSPPILHELGLLKAIKWHLENESEAHGFTYECYCNKKSINISDNKQIIIFRVFSEITTNIIKHADATNVLVDITQNNDMLTITVTDNGKGFNVNKDLVNTSSFGLFSIKERIEYLDGRFEIKSGLQKGTTAKISLPLNKNG